MKKLVFSFLLVLSFLACAEEMKLPKIPKENIRSQYRLIFRTKIEIGTGITLYSYDISGTAFGISKNQLICCAHEIEEKTSNINYALDLFDDDGVVYKKMLVDIKKLDRKRDLCLLETKEDLPFFIDVDKNKKPAEIGDWVYLIGARLGSVPYAISWGNHVSNKHEIKPELMASTATVFMGNSGGGMFEAENNTLIGVVQGCHGKTFSAFSLYVPLKDVREFLKDDSVVYKPEEHVSEPILRIESLKDLPMFKGLVPVVEPKKEEPKKEEPKK